MLHTFIGGVDLGQLFWINARLNGAFLLGLQGLVVKSHSYANTTALTYAIEATQDYVEMQVAERLQNEPVFE